MKLGTKPAEERIDHLLLGVNDLDRGIEWVEQITGVRAAKGGSHPGVGTRNALLSLGGRRYLEIMAPDPRQAQFGFRIDLRAFSEPRLFTWAVGTASIDPIQQAARELGYGVAGPDDGSRAKPDGNVLRWTVIGVKNPFDRPKIELVPFFIKWADDSPHPSQDSPGGCRLVSFEIHHPDPQGLTEALERLGIQARITRAREARLVSVLDTPKGQIELS